MEDVVVGEEFGQAALLFTEAIRAGAPHPSAALFAERAQALIDDGNFAAAAADAGRAADLDPTMPRAHLRKAVACIGLRRYASAKAAVQAGSALAPGDPRFARLAEELDGVSPATEAATKGGEGEEIIETTQVKSDGDDEEPPEASSLRTCAATSEKTPD